MSVYLELSKFYKLENLNLNFCSLSFFIQSTQNSKLNESVQSARFLFEFLLVYSFKVVELFGKSSKIYDKKCFVVHFFIIEIFYQFRFIFFTTFDFLLFAFFKFKRVFQRFRLAILGDFDASL